LSLLYVTYISENIEKKNITGKYVQILQRKKIRNTS